MTLSMRRIVLLLTVAALMAAMLVGSAVPAFAFHDYGHGAPPEKACQGVIIGGLAHSKRDEGPFPHP
jgi:hypothetical protein